VAGTGIGLALVKDLVEAQGGQVTLESTIGLGSTFTVTLPVAEPAGLPEAVAPAGSVPSATSPGSTPGDLEPLVAGLLVGPEPALTPLPAAGDGRPVLLLVEDSTDLRGYLARLLSDDGWNVMAVPDVPTALQLERAPDLILCDVMLPGPSGLDLVTVVRARREWASVPVVLLTARSGPQEVAKGLAVGADDYVGKPFSPIELLARLRTHHELAMDRNRLLAQAEQKAGHLETALTTNRTIGMAVGVLMSAHRVTSDRAFDLLRIESNNTNRKLRDVAEDVVLTGDIATTA
jgi:DNA-binding response OmpR family regulator